MIISAIFEMLKRRTSLDGFNKITYNSNQIPKLTTVLTKEEYVVFVMRRY